MKIFFPLFLLFIILLQGCNDHHTPKRDIYNADFGWTITIPENFDTLSAAQWAKIQSRGTEALEKTIDGKIENLSKTIFVFRSGEQNFFESNYQPFDSTVDGSYLDATKSLNEILYQTFASQMKQAKVDTASSVEKIGGLDFLSFKIKLTLPNGKLMHSLMYSRLFDKKDFSVSITYMDETKGKAMQDAWENSTFGK